MKKKHSMLLASLLLGCLVWIGYAYFNNPESPSSVIARAAATQAASSQAVPDASSGSVRLKNLSAAQAYGLMQLGAQNKDKLAALTDPRDLCTVVKGNAVMTDSGKLGEKRFSKAFETCADRTLHFEAAYMLAGSIIGIENFPKMKGGDFCGVSRLSIARAVLKYELEAGREIVDHDSTLENINILLDQCAQEGEFALPAQIWNEYANQAILIPFYGPTATAPTKARGAQAFAATGEVDFKKEAGKFKIAGKARVLVACTKDGHGFRILTTPGAPASAVDNAPDSIPVEQFMDGMLKAINTVIGRYTYAEVNANDARWAEINQAVKDFMIKFNAAHNIKMAWAILDFGLTSDQDPACAPKPLRPDPFKDPPGLK